MKDQYKHQVFINRAHRSVVFVIISVLNVVKSRELAAFLGV